MWIFISVYCLRSMPIQCLLIGRELERFKRRYFVFYWKKLGIHPMENERNVASGHYRPPLNKNQIIFNKTPIFFNFIRSNKDKINYDTSPQHQQIIW